MLYADGCFLLCFPSCSLCPQLTAYLIDDHVDRTFHDRTLHLSIYNVTPRLGKRPEQRDIYRHFVRTSDGTIIEAFEAAESMVRRERTTQGGGTLDRRSTAIGR